MAALASQYLKDARCVVIKVGSALLVEGDHLRARWLTALAKDVASLHARGVKVVLVSSGSIALGRGVLGLEPGKLTLEESQASAAIGQIQLATAYQEALAPHDITAAQVLLTLPDTQSRRRYLNARATLDTLLELGTVPIVNENDTVATDEIRYGDNDRLAAQIASIIGADLLVLLSDVDGLYTANPADDADARHLEHVEEITPEIMAMAGDRASEMSKGGMKTKLLAAEIATYNGAAMVIAFGETDHPIRAIEEGAQATVFAPMDQPDVARKRWISAMKPQGSLVIDEGAEHALHDGNSLLPAGVTAVDGTFERGAAVSVLRANGEKIAIGLCAYGSDEAQAIMGQNSSEIADILGYQGRTALIHRDDLVL